MAAPYKPLHVFWCGGGIWSVECWLFLWPVQNCSPESKNRSGQSALDLAETSPVSLTRSSFFDVYNYVYSSDSLSQHWRAIEGHKAPQQSTTPTSKWHVVSLSSTCRRRPIPRLRPASGSPRKAVNKVPSYTFLFVMLWKVECLWHVTCPHT